MLKDIDKMSLEEKLGQLFMPTYSNETVDGNIITLIKQYHIGGIFLTLNSIYKRKRIATMNRNLQYYATNGKPLFIASNLTNDELNDVSDLTTMPSEEIMHRLNNRLYTKQLAEVVGQELRDIGINSYAYPNLNLKASGNTRNEVGPLANHGTATVEGLDQSSVISFVTGFPAEDEIDSAIEVDRRKSNLYPFYEVIQKGADLITITDPSERLIREQIRTNLNFDNIIAYECPEDVRSTDYIKNHIVDAINNGVNLIILPFTFEEQVTILNKIIEALKLGDISTEAIDDSVEKLFSLKGKYNLNELGETRRPLTKHQIKSVKEKVVKQYTHLNVTT